MITKEPFYYRSANDKNMICGMKWIPEGQVAAVFQICHGMAEHLIRYDEFATFLAERGVLVIATDLIGHGHSVVNEDELGYFGDYLVNSKLVADLFRAKCIIQKEYSHVPYYILGHSMGSVIVRDYMLTHKEHLDGVILLGSVDYPDFVCNGGMGLVKLMSLFHKDKMKYQSALINYIGRGRFEKPFLDEELRNSWLTRDVEEVQKFNQDPLCNFVYSIGVYRDICAGLKSAHDKRKLEMFPKNIPILILSGSKDVVGDMGKTPKKIYKQYKRYEMNVRMHLYKGARHELLHETNREKVFQDIYKWLQLTMEK